MTLLDDFVVRAVLAGIGVAVVAGPLGCFVVWRKMAYFGDATAHAAVLGVSLALLSEMPLLISVALVTLLMAVGVALAAGRGYAVDTLLGVLSHAALAVGLVAVSLLPGVRVDMMSYLFGDILAVTRTDLMVIWGGAGGLLAIIVLRWRALVIATLSEDMAVAEGISPLRTRLLLMGLLALLVALALKIVGALLITAMLILPAAAARALARGPGEMAVLAALIGTLAALAGLMLSAEADTQAGPSIVVAATGLFLVSNALAAFRARA